MNDNNKQLFNTPYFDTSAYKEYFVERSSFFNTLNKNGLNKSRVEKSVKTISMNHEVTDDLLRNGDSDEVKAALKNEIALELVNKLMEQNLITIDQIRIFETDVSRFISSINVVEPGIRFSIVENDVFTVDEEKFSEEDIIAAIRATYPERFI